MEGDTSGVRILPPVLEFFDTEPNKVYQLNVNVTNVAKDSKTIRYYKSKCKVCLVYSLLLSVYLVCIMNQYQLLLKSVIQNILRLI